MKLLGIISCLFSIVYAVIFVIVQYSGRLSNFWTGGMLVFLGFMFCLFPVFQGIFGFTLKNLQSKKTIRWMRLVISLTLVHAVVMLVLGSFLGFPFLSLPLDIVWVFATHGIIRKERITVKKIFEDVPDHVHTEHAAPRRFEEPDVNEVDSEGLTPLMRAVLRDDVEDVRFLLKQPGIKVNLQHSTTGNTALCFAACNGLDEIAHLLILHPASRIGMRNDDGFTAFDLARSNGHYALAEELRF